MHDICTKENTRVQDYQTVVYVGVGRSNVSKASINGETEGSDNGARYKSASSKI